MKDKEIIEIDPVMEDDPDTVESLMPAIIFKNRELLIDPQAIEYIKYLTYFKYPKPGVGFGGAIGDIVNKALKEYLAAEFKELELEHFTDPLFEQRQRASKKKLEDFAQARENAQLVEVAKRNILEKEIERLKTQEKKTGKKISMEKVYPDVEVEMLRLTQYERNTLSPGDKTTIPKNVADRWEEGYIAKIITKGK